MSSELVHPEKQAEWHPSRAVMHVMGAHDRAHDAEAEEESDGQATMHETVVHDDVADRERRHADADPERDVVRASGRAAPDHERDRDGRMEQRERVVPLEAPDARLVMRGMHAPQRAVPETSMEEARPEIHGERDDDGDGNPEAHR